ncbi:MAG: hypothetical protein ACPF8V_05045 [Luteibaculum sp.]
MNPLLQKIFVCAFLVLSTSIIAQNPNSVTPWPCPSNTPKLTNNPAPPNGDRAMYVDEMLPDLYWFINSATDPHPDSSEYRDYEFHRISQNKGILGDQNREDALIYYDKSMMSTI